MPNRDNQKNLKPNSPIGQSDLDQDKTVSDQAETTLNDVEHPLQFHAPRRRMLGVGAGAAGAAVGISLGLHKGNAEAAKPPERMRPQPGDPLVHRFGEMKGQAVRPEHVPEGNLLLQAVSKDPVSGKMRDASRLNGLNLVQIDDKILDDKTRPYAAGGIIAYSSVCTHQGCDLTQWVPETTTFKCYCHYSEFDATHMGEPKHGPAKRRLAVLPIELNDEGEFLVAAKFVGRVGFKKK